MCEYVYVTVRLVTATDFASVYARFVMCDLCKWKKQATTEYVMIITTGITTQSTHSLHISTSTKKTAYWKPIFFSLRRQCNTLQKKKSVFQRRNNGKYTHHNNNDKCNTSQFNFIENSCSIFIFFPHNVHFPRVNCYLYICLYRFYIYRFFFSCL